MTFEKENEFERTETDYIYREKKTGKYYFSDEAYLLEGNGPYDTEEEATEKLKEYAKWLNQGDGHAI